MSFILADKIIYNCKSNRISPKLKRNPSARRNFCIDLLYINQIGYCSESSATMSTHMNDFHEFAIYINE